MVACDFCGATPPDDPEKLPLTWMTSSENGVVKVYCERCARENIRSIEAKLQSEWW
jgi:hypothetical protein